MNPARRIPVHNHISKLSVYHFFPRLAGVLITLLLGTPALFSSEPTEGEKLFALKVKPLFAEKCMACHGSDPEKIKGDFDMRTKASALKGGESYGDKVLIPGKGYESFLFQLTTRRVEDDEMPPKEADKLSQEQTWWIRDWINAGAPWPDEARVALIQDQFAEGVKAPTSGGLDEEWTNRRYKPEHLWAYRPLKVESPPEGVHPVDWFINQKLKATKLPPAPEAAPKELARRLSYGLTGLPPEPESIRKFTRNQQKDSTQAILNYARELMQSNHYGEHFGRQWLDVARYADSAGFANDYSRPNAWRYRDYVIRAFNDDKPYDQFVREQIAGDEIDTTDPEKLIATGFLRMGPWEQTGMSVFKVTRQQWLDDVTDSIGQTFLAQSLQCAKCHDHKFDPIPTKDYYSMMAVFSTTQFADRDVPFLEVENREGFEISREWTEAKIQAYQQQHKKLRDRVSQNRKKETGDAKVGNNGLDPGDEASLARMNKNILRHKWELEKTLPIAFSVNTGSTVARNNVSSRIQKPKNPWAKGYIEKDTILTGGSAFAEGAPVDPGALSVAELLGNMKTSQFPKGKGKRRKALADWIAAPDNPLTARVMVNRVWSWHFGKGIAGNPNNFGATGGLPTHPALLDFLADWFLKNGGSVKKLNELILTSSAYRRSTRHPSLDQLNSKDPKDQLYAAFKPRRLTAEELRDTMLSVSGELNPRIGGIPCRPDINQEVAIQPRQIMGGTASVYEPDPLPELRNRRSVYAEKLRGLRDPFFETFNQPGPDKSCELRETSTVAPQALTLFNASEMHDRALAFAARLLKDKKEAKSHHQASIYTRFRPLAHSRRIRHLLGALEKSNGRGERKTI
jgi:mono/diheme cytochrome c family protein